MQRGKVCCQTVVIYGEKMMCRNRSGSHGGMPARYNSKCLWFSNKRLAAGGDGRNDRCYDKNVHMTFMWCDEKTKCVCQDAGCESAVTLWSSEAWETGSVCECACVFHAMYYWVSLNVLKRIFHRKCIFWKSICRLESLYLGPAWRTAAVSSLDLLQLKVHYSIMVKSINASMETFQATPAV